MARLSAWRGQATSVPVFSWPAAGSRQCAVYAHLRVFGEAEKGWGEKGDGRGGVGRVVVGEMRAGPASLSFTPRGQGTIPLDFGKVAFPPSRSVTELKIAGPRGLGRGSTSRRRGGTAVRGEQAPGSGDPGLGCRRKQRRAGSVPRRGGRAASAGAGEIPERPGLCVRGSEREGGHGRARPGAFSSPLVAGPSSG